MDFKLLYSLFYQQNKKVKQLFSLVTYEESESPAMKHTKHFHGVNNLVQEINNIVQHRQECQTMEFDDNLFTVLLKLLILKGNAL